VEWREDAIALILVVVGSEPFEAAVDGDIPGISEAGGDDFEVLAIGIAAEDATFASPVVSGVVIVALIGFGSEDLWRWEIGGVFGRGDPPEFSEGFGCDAVWQSESFGVAFAHVEPAVGGPVESMETMFEITEICVEADIFIGDIIAVEITADGEIGGIGDPEVLSAPGESLNGVESAGEFASVVSLSVAIGVFDEDDAVAWGFGCWISVLGAHTDEHSSALIESEGAGLANEWFAGPFGDNEAWGYGGEGVGVGVGVIKLEECEQAVCE
jgi:hypothetical protein